MSDSEGSNVTLNRSFFDMLWPLILEKNVCHIKSKDTSSYFQPQRQFDELWAHDFLARKAFKDYQKPIEISCKSEEDQKFASKSKSEEAEDEVPSHALYLPKKAPTLQEQIHAKQCAQEYRECLANAFFKRKHPWFMPVKVVDQELCYTEEFYKQFKIPEEHEILKKLHTFDCKLMIINMGQYSDIGYFHRWFKFCSLVQMVAIVREQSVARQLLLLDGAFLPLLFQDNHEETWQSELTRALNEAINLAKLRGLFEDCSKTLMYVFPEHRLGHCIRFEVLKTKEGDALLF